MVFLLPAGLNSVTRERKMAESKHKESRRSFLSKLSIGSVLLAITGNLYAWIRFLIPNVQNEPVYRFKIGLLKHIPEGVKFLNRGREFIFRKKNRVHSVSAVCTHLGCTLKYVQLPGPVKVKIAGKEESFRFEFHCPCHGSKFYGDGTNYAGPAPSPLPWHKIERDPDSGELVLNKKIAVKQGTYFDAESNA